jgi:uncharacterized glyoxalase superfamily protein PhnB
MKVLALTPMLQTEDMDESIRFYTEVLGFTLDNRDESWGWAHLTLGHVSVMFSSPNEHAEISKSIFSGSFYFRVQNVDDVWEKLKDKTAVCYPIENFEYGMREFAIYDNNGYILQFGKPIDPLE